MSTIIKIATDRNPKQSPYLYTNRTCPVGYCHNQHRELFSTCACRNWTYEPEEDEPENHSCLTCTAYANKDITLVHYTSRSMVDQDLLENILTIARACGIGGPSIIDSMDNTNEEDLPF